MSQQSLLFFISGKIKQIHKYRPVWQVSVHAIRKIHNPFPIISSRKCYWKIPVQYYKWNVYLRLCVLCFSSLVSTGPHTCSLVWYNSKKGVGHNLMLHTGHLNYIAAVFSGTHTAPNFITFQRPVFVVCVMSF